MLSEDTHRSFRSLVDEALEQVVTTPEALIEHQGGFAVHHPVRDARLTELASFEAARESLSNVAEFAQTFGSEHADRATLQLLYLYFSRAGGVVFDESAFEQALRALADATEAPAWINVAFANLRTFSSDEPLLDFGDGLTIRHRSFDDLEQQLGWTSAECDFVTRDWMDGHISSSHVVWVEVTEPKGPGSVLEGGDAAPDTALRDLIQALWLYAPGDLTFGSVFRARATPFRLSGGIARTGGMPGDVWGTSYVLSSADIPSVRAIYDDLVALRKLSDVTNNVHLALRRYASVYGRGLRNREDRIVDQMIALEAILGPSTAELKFRLAYRVASILAADDLERVRIFESMKGFYDLRSKIVHGSELKAAERKIVDDDIELRAIVRRLLRGLIHGSVHSGLRLTRAFEKELDTRLMNEEKRQALRGSLGFGD